MLYYEKKLKKLGFDLIIGIDEAGRGPLAGPVVAAAVALKTYRFKNRIDDSKKLTSLGRTKAFREIIRKGAFGIGIVDEKIIDAVNILEATKLAMRQALESLLENLDFSEKSKIHVIVDGRMSLDISWPYTSIVEGDGKSKTIASASILAKVTRDSIMKATHKLYPQYGFCRHKGYPTAEHRAKLKKFGPSEIHRKTFLRCLEKDSL